MNMYRLWCIGVVSPPGGFESAPLFRPGCLGHWCLCYHYCLSHCYPSPCCCYYYFSLVSLPADWGLKDNMKYSFKNPPFLQKLCIKVKIKGCTWGRRRGRLLGALAGILLCRKVRVALDLGISVQRLGVRDYGSGVRLEVPPSTILSICARSFARSWSDLGAWFSSRTPPPILPVLRKLAWLGMGLRSRIRDRIIVSV